MSYNGSEVNYVYGYPAYTAYKTKYSEDYKKVEGFSNEYSILTASKEKTYADFEARFGLPKGSVGRFTQWGEALANTAALVGTVNVGKSVLNNDFSKVVPKEANANSKLPVIGKTAGYENQTIRITINDDNVWSSAKKLTSQENVDVHWNKNKFLELKNSDDYLNKVYSFINNLSKGTLVKVIDNDDITWEKGVYPTYNICPWCGVEFGYEDIALKSIRKYRNNWILNRCNWFIDIKISRKKWDFYEQFKNITHTYR